MSFYGICVEAFHPRSARPKWDAPVARDDAMADAKPAILQDTRFTIREGFAYRAFRTGAIWMNKLFFASLFLLGVWLLWAVVGGETGCVEDVPQAPEAGVADEGTGSQCSVFLSPTAKYLGAMAVLSFILSIGFGALGLVVGKQVLQVAKASEEVGAQRPEGEDVTGDEPRAPQ